MILIADLADVDLLVSDAESGFFLECNQSAHEHLGFSREELFNLSPETIQADPDHDVAWVAARRQELVQAGGSSFQTRHRRKDGAIRDVWLNHRVIRLDERRVIVSVAVDRTLQRRKEALLEDTVAMLDDVESLSGIGGWDFRFLDGRMRWSRQMHHLCRTDPESLTPSLWGYTTLIHQDDRPGWRREFRRAIDRGERLYSRHRLTFADGGESLVEVQAEVVYDAEGRGQKMIGTIRDASKELLVQRQIELMRSVDGLTGLPNKLASQEQLELLIRGRNYNASLAVLSIDIDGFQEINDNFGSEFGDRLLRAISERLRELIGDEAWLGRISSDEFLIISSTDISSIGDAISAGRRLQHAWGQQAPLMDDLAFIPTLCIGIATFPEHAQNSRALLQCANTALMEAKRAGHSQTCIYSSTLSRQIHERMELAGELSRAIDRQQLRLVIQPQSHRSGTVAGGEVLMRWTNHRGTPIPPSEFIPLAEDNGLIFQLSHWALHALLNQVRTWQDMGYRLPRLAINISPRELEMPGRRFISQLLDILNEYNVSTELLELEITETTLLRNPLAAREQLSVLADHGFRIAIDDFGTGYSSLELLRTLPIHKLKIDQCFVRGITVSAADQAIIKATLTLAEGLNLECIAEGVETEEQRKILEEMGCNMYQGYLFSRPLEIDGFERLLARETAGSHPLLDNASHQEGHTGIQLHPSGSCGRTPSPFEQIELLRSAFDMAVDYFVLLQAYHSPDGSIIDFVFVDANLAACHYMQQDKEVIIGQRLLAVYPQTETNGLLDAYIDAITRKSPVSISEFAYRNLETSKDDRVFDIQVTPTNDLLTVTWRDVTDRYRLTRHLADTAALYKLLTENIVEVVVLLDADQVVHWVSPSLHPMLGWKPKQWIGKRFRDLFVAAQGRPFPMDLEDWLSDYGKVRQGRLRVVDPRGGWSWADLSVRRIEGQGLRRFNNSQIDEDQINELNLENGFVCTVQIADQQVMQEHRLLQLAKTDSLTGLENRATILEWVQKRLLDARADHPQNLAALYCDFDDFKAINDNFGHAGGDEALRTVAARILQTIRSQDHAGRLGGDEFLVLLDGIQGVADAMAVAEKLRQIVNQPIEWEDTVIHPSVSIGVAVHGAGEDAQLFLRRADRAMYSAKSGGRNQVVVL